MLCRGACTIIYFTTMGKHTTTFFHANMKKHAKNIQKTLKTYKPLKHAKNMQKLKNKTKQDMLKR